jgi:hypothetical protein
MPTNADASAGDFAMAASNLALRDGCGWAEIEKKAAIAIRTV